MTSLPTYIKEKEEAFDEQVVQYINPEAMGSSIRDDARKFLTQAIKDSYALGIERAIEVAEGMRRSWNVEPSYTRKIVMDDLTALLQKELSSIREV